MRSWDSLTRISHAARPWYFRGHLSRSIVTPPLSPAISPREEERPPAPLSVMPRYSPRSRASSSMSSIFFWVIGSPICTAEVGEDSLSASEEKVAPWIPSLPILPPAMTARSPERTSFAQASRPRIRAGSTPPVPQKTSGFPR